MEQAKLYDSDQASSSPPQGQRQRGVIAELNEAEGGGYIRFGSRQLRFRAIDIVGNQAPKSGESVSFLVVAGGDRDRASQAVLDRDPQFIRGQGSLQDCYQANANIRAAKIARQQRFTQQKQAKEAVAAGLVYRHCVDCQRMVLPKQRRKRARLGLGAVQWLQSCPVCLGLLDQKSGTELPHPLPIALLLGAVCAWWLF
jgi:hypothetical protein